MGERIHLGKGSCLHCGAGVNITQSKTGYATFTCNGCKSQTFARGFGLVDTKIRESVIGEVDPFEEEEIEQDIKLDQVKPKRKKESALWGSE